MRHADEDSCRAAGIDPKKVESLCRRLDKIGREADEMGLFIFGSSGVGTLRTHEKYEHGNIVVGFIGVSEIWEGGSSRTIIIDEVQYGE